MSLDIKEGLIGVAFSCIVSLRLSFRIWLNGVFKCRNNQSFLELVCYDINITVFSWPVFKVEIVSKLFAHEVSPVFMTLAHVCNCLAVKMLHAFNPPVCPFGRKPGVNKVCGLIDVSYMTLMGVGVRYYDAWFWKFRQRVAHNK